VVEEFWTCKDVIEYLGIEMNNLRQLQWRGTIKWKKKEGKTVFYSADDIRSYKSVRDSRKQR
jgi:hypothetical protein